MKNSKLLYELEEVKEQSLNKQKELNYAISELEETIDNISNESEKKILTKQQ